MNENCRPKRDKVQNMWEKKSKKGHRDETGKDCLIDIKKVLCDFY
jgi:hypothetical protein